MCEEKCVRASYAEFGEASATNFDNGELPDNRPVDIVGMPKFSIFGLLL